MNSFFSSTSYKGSDETARYIRKKIHETEKNMAQLKKSIDAYLRSHEKVRGRRLEMALVLKAFSESETPNVKAALQTAAETMVDLEEYRKYMHDRMDSKTGESLKVYNVICKNLKDEVKTRENIVAKEHKKQLELDKTTIKDQGNLSKITQSQLELNNAIQELGFANTGLVEKVEKFHQKKATDVKEILFEIIYSEIQFHARALETLTSLHHNLTATSTDTDIYEIRERVKTPTAHTPSIKSP